MTWEDVCPGLILLFPVSNGHILRKKFCKGVDSNMSDTHYGFAVSQELILSFRKLLKFSSFVLLIKFTLGQHRFELQGFYLYATFFQQIKWALPIHGFRICGFHNLGLKTVFLLSQLQIPNRKSKCCFGICGSLNLQMRRADFSQKSYRDFPLHSGWHR